MVKSLKDICIGKISLWYQLFDFHSLDSTLTREDREKVLLHVSNHQQIDSQSISFLTSVLVVKPLKRIELHFSRYVQDYVIEAVAKNSPFLEHVSIIGCKNVTDNGVLKLLENQRKLWFLHLENLPLINGKCLKSLQSSLLKMLILKSLQQLQEIHLIESISNCSNLSILDLQHCPSISDSSILAASAILKEHLVVLKISGASKVTDQSIEGLVKHTKNLKKLKLYGCNKLTTSGINSLLKTLPLEEIDLSYTVAYTSNDGGRNGFQADEFPPSLQRFEACGVQLPSCFLVDLVNSCHVLTDLVLCGVRSLNDHLLNVIGKACGNHLLQLDLSYCDQVTDSGLNIAIQRFRVLETLKFQHFQGTGTPITSYYEESRREQAGKLKEISFPACRYFDGSHLELALIFFKNLTKLDVSGMKNVGDPFLHIVAIHCNQLRLLCLKACKKVSDNGLCPVFKNGSPIEKLVLSGNPKLTDQCVFTMASHLPNTLTSLFISGCTRISKQAIRYLKDECVNGVYVQHIVPNAPPERIMGRDLDTGQFFPMNGSDADLFYWTPTI